MNQVFSGTVKAGEVILNNPTRYLQEVRKLEGKQIEAIIRVYKSSRSNNQNNYYWGVVLPVLGGYFGYTADEMHDALKYKFLRRGAADLETVTSTTKLNTAQFEEYLENVRRWAVTEYGVSVPLPNEIEPA